MKTTLKARCARYATICCVGLACSNLALAQTYGTEATLTYYPSAFRLNLQAVRVGDSYYAVTLANPALQVGNEATWSLACEAEARKGSEVSWLARPKLPKGAKDGADGET